MIRRKGPGTPRIGAISLGELEPGEPGELHRGARIDGLAFDQLEVETLELADAVVMECTFTDVGAEEVDLRSIRLRDTVVSRARFPSVRSGRGDWRDVRIEGSRIGSAEMYESNWGSVHFVDCKMTYLNLRAATLRDVAFTRCTIEELDLADATAQNVAILASSVQILDIQRAELAEVDLRGAELGRITGLSQLSGATVSSAQLHQLAPLLAADLGMIVDDAAPPEIQ